MKVLIKDQVTLKSQIQNSLNEQKILKLLIGKPFISCLRFSFQNDEKLFLITDYYENGELFYHLKKLKFFDTDVLRFYLAEVLTGMESMHDLHII